jgi:hypothetical protein
MVPTKYVFYEPHYTGGHSEIIITCRQILEYMKNKYVDCNTYMTDDELIDDFCVIHYATKLIKDKEV